VKDQNRFPDKWAYFNFDEESTAAKVYPKVPAGNVMKTTQRLSIVLCSSIRR
jgi:hypothetical protein